MQLGSRPTESLLPPRFERLYQPEKIAQFDRFFARAWATPVRRSHSAQHSKGSSDDETGARDFRRSVSARQSNGPGETDPNALTPEEEQQDKGQRKTKTLDNFVNSYGLQPYFKPTLKSFVKHHDIKHANNGVSSRPPGKKCKRYLWHVTVAVIFLTDYLLFCQILSRTLAGVFGAH